VPDLQFQYHSCILFFYSRHNVVAVCLDFVNIFSPICEFSIRGLLYTQTLHLVGVKEVLQKGLHKTLKCKVAISYRPSGI
jgi:hypothetical protein